MRRGLSVRLCIGFVIVTTALMGCGEPAATDSVDERDAENANADESIPEGEWRLISGTLPDGRIAPIEEEPITLTTSGDDWSGWDGCNSYQLTVEPTSGSAGEVVPMERLGGDAGCVSTEVERTAARYSGVLMRLDGYAFEDGVLRLFGPEFELRYERK